MNKIWTRGMERGTLTPTEVELNIKQVSLLWEKVYELQGIIDAILDTMGKDAVKTIASFPEVRLIDRRDDE